MQDASHSRQVGTTVTIALNRSTRLLSEKGQAFPLLLYTDKDGRSSCRASGSALDQSELGSVSRHHRSLCRRDCDWPHSDQPWGEPTPISDRAFTRRRSSDKLTCGRRKSQRPGPVPPPPWCSLWFPARSWHSWMRSR